MSQKSNFSHKNVGRSPNGMVTALKEIKGDGNCLFHALYYVVTGWETAHLKVR